MRRTESLQHSGLDVPCRSGWSEMGIIVSKVRHHVPAETGYT
jgi:hypothetical protein